MNGTEHPRNSGTRTTRESYDRLAVLRPSTLPPPRRWLSSGCIVFSWNERWKSKNVTCSGRHCHQTWAVWTRSDNVYWRYKSLQFSGEGWNSFVFMTPPWPHPLTYVRPFNNISLLRPLKQDQRCRRSLSKYTACKNGQKTAKMSPKMGNGCLPVGFRIWVQETYCICTSLQVLCTYKVSCMYVKAKGDQSLLMSFRMIGKSVKTWHLHSPVGGALIGTHYCSAHVFRAALSSNVSRFDHIRQCTQNLWQCAI